MNAEPRSVNRSFEPSRRVLAPLPPDGRVRVLQFGPSLTVRGGITLGRAAHLRLSAAVRVDAARADDGRRLRAREGFGVRARGAGAAARARIARSDHRAHPLRVARQHAAQADPRGDGGARRAARWCCMRTVRNSTHSTGELPAAVRRNVNRTLQRANVFITLSTQWRDFYVEECEISPSQIVVLPNPVRVPAEVPDRATGATHVQFLHLGRLGERKGTYDLVNAFAGLPEALRDRARLVLAGDGDVEGVRKLAEPLARAGRGALVDRRARARPAARRRAMCSCCRRAPKACRWRCSKRWPMACRRSPRRVGGIPDVFRDGVDGVFVKPGNVEQIRAAMARMITDDAARLAAGRAAREHARALRRARVRAPPGGHLPAHRTDIGDPGILHERDAGIRRSPQAARRRRESRAAQSVLLRAVAPPARPARSRRTSRAAAPGRASSSRARCGRALHRLRQAWCAAATTLDSWPLLDKELLRNRLHAFTTGSEWFSAPANTGGTGRRAAQAGALARRRRVRAGLHRPARGRGSACIRAPCAPRSCAATTCRIRARCALPDGVSANGGRSRIFCARARVAQEHRTHRRFAREVRAATAVRLSERARVAVPAAAANNGRTLQDARGAHVLRSAEARGLDAGAGGARLPHRRLLRAGRARRLRLCVRAARVPLPARLLVRRVPAARLQTTAGRRGATGSTRSSAPRSGTTSCRWCAIAPAT